MFISRKKYEEALDAARKEGAEKVWEQQQKERYMDDICRRFEMVEKRLSCIEDAHRPVKANGPTVDEVTFTACSPCRCF